MKIFYIKNGKKIYFKIIKDIKLKKNINDRFLAYRHLKNNLKNKFKNFYLFYDNNDILNCFLDIDNFNANEFTEIKINDSFLKNQVTNYILYKKAYNIVEKYHKKQIYGGFLPYIFHLNKVDSVIDHYFYEVPQEKIFIYKTCALLHDIIEDTSYTMKELENTFGNEISNIVFNLTKINEEHTKDYEINYYNKVAGDLGSIYVKMADKIINAKQTLKDKSKNHIIGMTNGHPFFIKMIYNKFSSDDIKEHLDLIMKKMERLKND